MVLAKIVVTVVDVNGSDFAKQNFKNPPKEASEILEQLSMAGYDGSLLDADGYSLSGKDPVDDTQEYRLVLPAPSLPGHLDARALQVARMAAEMTAKKILKRLQPTTTTNYEKGELVIRSATIDEAFFARQLAGHRADIVENLLSSPVGQSLQNNWNQASSEEELQANINKLFPAVLGTRDVPGGKYWDTHRSGLEGIQLKIDASVMDTDMRAAPHIVTLAELKLHLLAQHSTAVGDAVNCVAELHTSQPQREHFLVAVIGTDAIQLWWVRAAPAQAGLWEDLRPICTNRLPLAMQADSEGLQMLVRWLRTDWGALGYFSPALPPPVPLPKLPGWLTFTGKLLGNTSTYTSSGNYKPSVLVYAAQLQMQQPACSSGSSSFLTSGDDEVVVKVPRNHRLFHKEVQNLAITAHIPDIRSRCIRLQCTCDIMIGSEQRSAMVLQPKAEHIPLDITPPDLLSYVRSLVDALQRLYEAGYLHCDLSYFNLLYRNGLPLLADMQTLTPVHEALGVDWAMGTRLFMALRTLKGGGHSIGTELETVLNVIIYVLLGGVLPWQSYVYHEGARYIAGRQGYMSLSFEQQVLAKVPWEARAWLCRMRNLFFPLGTYITNVTCQQFLEACTLEP